MLQRMALRAIDSPRVHRPLNYGYLRRNVGK